MQNVLYLLLVTISVTAASPISNLPNYSNDQRSGRIFVAGGYNLNATQVPSVYSMNTATQEWTSLPDLPTATFGSKLFYAGNKLIITGGSIPAGTFLVYDESTNKWQSLDGPDVGFGPSGVVYECSLFLIGGLTEMKSVYVLDPFQSKMAWKNTSRTINYRYYSGAAVIGDHIYVCGGGLNDVGTCEKYDPSTSLWSLMPSMHEARIGQTLVELNGYLYAVGGNTNGTAERYNPAEANKWSYIKSLNDPARTMSVAVTDGSFIYVLGGCSVKNGCSAGHAINTVERYDPTKDQWAILPNLPDSLAGSNAAYWPNKQ